MNFDNQQKYKSCKDEHTIKHNNVKGMNEESNQINVKGMNEESNQINVKGMNEESNQIKIRIESNNQTNQMESKNKM